MKTILITLVAITLINFCAKAQMNSKDRFTTSSSIERVVGNNTAILVNYDNKVPAVIKGPFEYACKLYSEVLPASFPLRIKVIVKDVQAISSMVEPSRVHPDDVDDPIYPNLACYTSQIKSTLMTEEIRGAHSRFEGMIRKEFIDTIDFTISYQKKFLNEASYNLDGTRNGKYDFVTHALRDITSGIGFHFGYNGFSNWSNNYYDLPPTYYEYLIKNLLGDDPEGAYAMAVSGDIFLSFGNGGVHYYAPDVWEERSLNYTMPEDDEFSKLMSYNFEKDHILRDLRLLPLTALYEEVFGWTSDILVGDYGTEVTQSKGIVPYLGTIQNDYTSRLISYSNTQFKSAQKVSINSALAPYLSYTKADEYQIPTTSLAVMLKDGTWDIIYFDMMANSKINLNNAEFHHNMEDYFRTYDGHLKAQFVYSYFSLQGKRRHYICNYVLSYLPQQVAIPGYIGEASAEDIQNSPSLSKARHSRKRLSASDDYCIDVNVAIKNLEGTSQIKIEQWEEGDPAPIEWWEDDFRKGYFTTVIDKEYPTTFRITAYNENGQTSSEKITLYPNMLTSTETTFDININDRVLKISAQEDVINTSTLQYKILKLQPNGMFNEMAAGNSLQIIDNEAAIDMSNMETGFYVIQYGTPISNFKSYKFQLK